MTSSEQNIFKNLGDHLNDDSKNKQSIDDKIKEIEARIRGLYDNKSSQNLNISRKQLENDLYLKQKLDSFRENIQHSSNEMKSAVKDPVLNSDGTQSLFSQAAGKYSEYSERDEDLSGTLSEIQDRISKLNTLTESQPLSNNKQEDVTADKLSDKERELFAKMFNAFYEESKKIDKKSDEDLLKDKLENFDEKISNVKEGLSSHSSVEQEIKSDVRAKSDELKKIEGKVDLKSEPTQKKVEAKQVAPHGPITIRPKQKKEGLFNDINLTEDYELGFRFHELGFKTGFFNVKLDEDDDSSRIATAEFFPNTFWAAVKQRSRWVAGIVFQNWKSHKWSGNLVTKYFLFRDRKSVFSFFSAFLSNVVLLYLLFAVLSKIFQWTHVNSLVGHSSVLWLLMISNLVFMISRLSHRFIFTYNWYGFSYAFFSLFRLPVDTIVNFFAIARSFSVYKNTKSKAKVVWDSTTHYKTESLNIIVI